jgi:hypothetical protein
VDETQSDSLRPWEVVLPSRADHGGSVDAFRVGIGEVRLDGGNNIELPVPGVTVIVGANNVGKSVLLRQMAELLHHFPTLPLSEGYRLAESQQLTHSGSRADLVAWLGVHSHFIEQRGGRPAGFVRFGQQQPLPPTTAAQAWDRVLSGASPGSLGELAPFILHNADPTARREMVGGVGARQTADEPPTHPLHYMEDDRTLLRRLSELSQEVFGYPLTLDTTSTALLLRVGTPSIPAPRVDKSQAAYRADMARLPLLSQQGDGMRSFLGLLLPLITASHPIVLVDEPEAFLHPPQAAALGRALSALARDNKLQVILATHDRNLLTGLLDVVGVPISIVRLHRDRNLTVPYQLNPDDVRGLWTDVTLRYTNVIDGLFHRLVIIAEADRDCRFYAATLDAVHEDAPLTIPPSEVLFVPSNGKQGMARLVRALKAVHTPVVTSPDLDILNDEGVLRALVRELEGTWDNIAQDYRIATDPFRQPRDPARNSDVLDAIQGVLGSNPEQTYNADTRDKVLAQLRSNESRWQALKTAGDRAFTGAQATAAGQRLLNALDGMGVVTVRVGQLERFGPTVEAGKGPAWLAAALEADAHKDADVVAHMRRLLQSGLEKMQIPETASGASSESVRQTSSDESSQTNTPPR